MVNKNTREYNHAYWKKWYPKNRKKVIKASRDWRIANKKKMQAHRIKWLKNNPWFKHYHAAKQRCSPSRPYGKRGICFFMTVKEFKILWNRDNACLMKSPSIDRLDGEKHYTFENCRFMELLNNKRRKRLKTEAR
jgi:hypothetical protein